MMKIMMRRQILGGEGNQSAELVSSRIVRSTREVLTPSMSRMLLVRSLRLHGNLFIIGKGTKPWLFLPKVGHQQQTAA
ncbi:hypothetical protein S245_005593 [Arachis hypogaea]